MTSEMSRLRTVAAVRESKEQFVSNQEMLDQFIFDLKYYLGLEGKLDDSEKLSYRQNYTTLAVIGGASALLLLGLLFSSLNSLVFCTREAAGPQYSPTPTIARSAVPPAVKTSAVSQSAQAANSHRESQQDFAPITMEQVPTTGDNTIKSYAIHEASALDVEAEAPVIVFEKPTLGETELQEAILSEQEAEKFMPGIGKHLQQLSSASGRTQPFDLE